MSRITELVIAVAVIVALGVGVESYVKAREDRAKLQAQLDSDKVLLAHLDADAKERAVQFEKDKASLLAQRPTAQTTPAQVVERIPQFINFPTAPKMETEASPITGKLETNMVLDPPNQKILLTKLVDCKVCEVENARLRGDLQDAGAKLKITEQDRDKAVRAVKGTFWQHVSGSKWLKLVVFAGGVYAGSRLK